MLSLSAVSKARREGSRRAWKGCKSRSPRMMRRVLRRGAGGVAGALAALAALGVHALAGGARAVAEVAVAVALVGLAFDLGTLPGGIALGFLAVAALVDG